MPAHRIPENNHHSLHCGDIGNGIIRDECSGNCLVSKGGSQLRLFPIEEVQQAFNLSKWHSSGAQREYSRGSLTLKLQKWNKYFSAALLWYWFLGCFSQPWAFRVVRILSRLPICFWHTWQQWGKEPLKGQYWQKAWQDFRSQMCHRDSSHLFLVFLHLYLSSVFLS